ncbi:MAG: hypothetical protein GOMPHAMPRED_008149 [Gomphillus americanus]|uniref:Alpha/beta-hydrolase n=1 Tax=Gomphillus americanus TaxID=1940652 RepID=A0A8H3IFY9_9LECA|nr:MAG: hypothetical protein GOMPHAMPRED_008149 [Gomphillus americanus]
MDGKSSFRLSIPDRQSMSRSIAYLTIIIVLCFLLYDYCWGPGYPTSPLDQHYAYKGEKITWKACGDIAGRKLECSRIDVPMDHFNLSKSGGFNLPVVRLRGDDGSKNLWVSPGGPGVSGVAFLHNRGEKLATIIGSRFHLITFDARGINGSRPQALCYPSTQVRKSLSIPEFQPIEYSPEVYAWTKNFVQGCRDTMSEHGLYINTPQTAADMNTVLDALGQHEMFFWGISYATALGQTYATIFPERSHRIVVDGVVSNFRWYEDPFSDSGSLQDAERVLYGFFEECMKAGNDCPLSVLADTAEELQDKVLSFAGKLKEPVSIYINRSQWGLLRSEDLIYTALFGALYSPATWWSVADRLNKLLQGNATEAFLAWGSKGPYADWLVDEALYFIANNDNPSGPDHWPQDRHEFLDLVRPLLNESLFSPAMHLSSYKRQQWLIPKTHDFRQKMNVKTAHPLLVLSTTWDPVTPFSTTGSVLAAFEGSQILELEGYGHTTFAMPSRCVAKHVRAFLYDGTLVEKHTKCKVDGPYFMRPDQDVPRFIDSDDEAIYRAQLQIARDGF